MVTARTSWLVASARPATPTGKKNGAKIIRSLIRRTRQWGDAALRVATGEVARSAGAHRVADALVTKNVLQLRKEDIFWLARQWGLRSNIWRRRSSADVLLAASSDSGDSLAAARKRARLGAPAPSSSSCGDATYPAGTANPARPAGPAAAASALPTNPLGALHQLQLAVAPRRPDPRLLLMSVQQNALPTIYNTHVRNHELMLARGPPPHAPDCRACWRVLADASPQPRRNPSPLLAHCRGRRRGPSASASGGSASPRRNSRRAPAARHPPSRRPGADAASALTPAPRNPLLSGNPPRRRSSGGSSTCAGRSLRSWTGWPTRCTSA